MEIVNKHLKCMCGGSYENNNYSKKRHSNTIIHKKYIKKNNKDIKNIDEYKINEDIKEINCGKTKTIINYCINKKIIKDIDNSKNFLIITFSKKAQLDFIAKGKKTQYHKLFNKQNIRTIHSLAGYITYNKFKKTSGSLNTIILTTYKNILNNVIEINDILQFNKCKYIIIDEAQDINENQYKLALIISEKLNIPLILVGDPNQNIYQFQGGTDKYLLNHSRNK